MSFYDKIAKRLKDEQSKKRLRIYNGANQALVTRFFSTKKPYPNIDGNYVSNVSLFNYSSVNQIAANQPSTNDVYTMGKSPMPRLRYP